jgi:hypothetical protein
MAAGDSAREVALRTAAASDALRRRAERVEQMSSDFAQGAVGEAEVAEALEGLSRHGWASIDDRSLSMGGNIDLIRVGPPGVAVIDAKKWSYPVTVKGGRLYTGKFSKAKDVARIIEQVHIVESSLRELPYSVAVRGFLALAGEADRSREEVLVDKVRVIGADLLMDKLVRARQELSSEQVGAISKTLESAFPATDSAIIPRVHDELPTLNKPGRIFERSHRFLYLCEWRKAGFRRLCLKSSSGEDLGWKEVNSGEIHLDCEGDDAKLARAVLESASLLGMSLSAHDLPKVPIDLPGGNLLSWLTKIHTSLLIGQEWKKGSRLYGTLVDSPAGTFQLGYVDLKTGSLHPSVLGKLSKNHATAERYLRRLVERSPL